MLNLKISRRIRKNIKWFTLNLLGLSIALACLILVFAFISNELSYDKFHSKSDRIYRITQNTNTGKSSMIDARVWIGMVEGLSDQFPQIENYLRLSSYRNAMVSIEENTFYSRKVFGVDSSFFNVFDFNLILGNKASLFTRPNEVVITASTAQKYFGSISVLGKQIDIMHQKQDFARTYTIKGVLEDFPQNSHFKADMLCTLNNELDSWAYSYLLLRPRVNELEFENQIQQVWDEQNADNSNKALVNLQAIGDIHLHSHKSREMEANGKLSTLFLLASGMMIILIIALANFSNLNYVQYINEQNAFMVKAVNGATPSILANEFLKETWVLLLIATSIALALVYYLAQTFSLVYLLQAQMLQLSIISLAFFILVSFIAVLPFYKRKTNFVLKTVAITKNASYKYFVILQLALAIFAISSTLFIQKQLKHINNLHPNVQNENLLVLPNITKNATQNYQTLKEQVLKHPEIIAVTAAMEEPAGIVTDNFPYTLEGDKSSDQKTINILVIDPNFPDFFKLKTVAGVTDFGTPTTLEWEQKMLYNWINGINTDEIQPIQGKYVVNRMALKHMGIASAQEAIGMQFDITFMGSMFPKGEIIGVVEDFHYTNMYVKEKPLVLIPRKVFCRNLLFRIDANNKTKAIATLKNEWEKLNPNSPFNFEFVSDTYQKVYKNEYMQMRVIMLFAIISIILASLGLFAMVAYSLKARIKEIGIRRTNGAKVSEIIQMLLKSYLIWIAIAVALALPLAYFSMHKWLESFAYKTSISWWIFALSGFMAFAITLVTVGWQTFKAARRNPVEALRYE